MPAERGYSLAAFQWSPDGSQLLFSAGPWENQKLIAVKVSDGSAEVLGQGTMIDVVDHIQ